MKKILGDIKKIFSVRHFNEILAKLDYTLLLLMYLLVFISTVFVYSATRNYNFVIKNLVWISIGTIFYFIIININYNKTEKYIWYIYGASTLLLLYALFLGNRKLGAQRWISVFGFNLQPSEFVKIVVCLVISYHLVYNMNKKARTLLDIFYGILPASILMILILLQPDLGTTLILIFSYLCILYLSNSNIKPLIILGAIVVIAAFPVYRYVLHDYQRTRIEIFLNPEKDKKGKGWHITQSKISIGSGQMFGKGLLNGTQSRLKFLPEPQTDFIFSVISEELGFVGAIVVLAIYMGLILNILAISTKIEHEYGRYIIYGIAGIFIAHLLINVGMTLGLVPVTGKPLLLLSYGGSSLISSFCMLALVQNIKIYDKKWKE